MRFHTLAGWLDWQQQLHPRSIQLGLDRVRQVYDRLQLAKIANTIITVAGTNGKGSTVAYYETWLKQAGYKVASYTSPHLLRYNERIKLNLSKVSDQDLCEAFDRIDQARKEISLTYFEFGTLAAFILMSQFKPDVAILEVGLGGRLDAVNIVDPDLAHITPVGLDHQDWLGDDVESIGREKAGILRTRGLAVCNSYIPPKSILEALALLQCRAVILGRDYRFERVNESVINWMNAERQVSLEVPLKGDHQALNLSGVLAGLSLLGFLAQRSDKEISAGFAGVVCDARFQRVAKYLPFQLYLDVGHNEDAARALAETMKTIAHQGRVVVLFGMLADKNPVAFVTQLAKLVDEWWLLGLEGERGLSASQLAIRIGGLVNVQQKFESTEGVLAQAMSTLGNKDILLVAGSFKTVEAMLHVL